MSQAALLVIDAQIGLIESEDQLPYRKEELLATLEALLHEARKRCVPVIYVQDQDVGAGNPRLNGIHPRIAPVLGDPVIKKSGTSAFFRTDLDAVLKQRRVDHLILAGLKTEYCVDTSARHAISLGYQVTLVEDGHSTTPNGVLSADAIVAHHNRNLNGLENDEFEIRVTPRASLTW